MSAGEDYVLLGLRLGRHGDGLVDAYYGPAELKAQVDAAELVPPWQLVTDAAALHGSLADGWLRDQVAGCLMHARVLAGEEISYSDEVEGSYGVRPTRTPGAAYERVHAELDELLPGPGTLAERRQAWRERHLCPGDKAIALLNDLLPLLRARTLEVVELPEGERVTIEPVSGELWWAFNYYLGDLHSRVVLNTDVPTTGLDLVHLAAHEVYPGHHVDHSLKEQLLARDRGLVEETIAMVPTPQAVLSEGIAEIGADVVLDEAAREEAYAIIRRHGVELVDPALSERISRAIDGLRTVSLNAALMIFEDGASLDEAKAYVQKWTLNTPEQAAQSVRFVTDPTWRAYAITYSAGRELCGAYVGNDPAKLRRLLTEHVRIGELLSA
ncbi:MAG: hypothetical protein ACXVQQ_00985 [Gaiellaceae bacterium]